MTVRDHATHGHRNPSIEFRNPKQIQMLEIQMLQTRLPKFAFIASLSGSFAVSDIRVLLFEFVSYFVLRISDFCAVTFA
jgi:hypothetical protein